MNNIKILIYDKGYKAQGFFLGFNGLYEMDSIEELIKLFLDNLEVILMRGKSFNSYKQECIKKNPQTESILLNREKEFESIKNSKIIETNVGNFEFRIKII
jgi:hypothetical protein